jgi:hypothetical protein
MGGMSLPAVERLWQTLSENEMALVCVRGPAVRFEDLTADDDDGRQELNWMAREVGEITEQYRHGIDCCAQAP